MHSLPEKPDWLGHVTILGVGLLGGSVGMSLRRSGIRVTGFSRRQASCDSAVQSGAVDEGFTDLARACDGSDVVVIASPVNRIAELAVRAGPLIGRETLITDVGSTKAELINEIRSQSAQTADQFVAAHPIAGSEKTGVDNATSTLLDRKLVILTPDEQTDHNLLERAKQFWSQTGSQLVLMSPTEHDRRLALVSHVPHLISSVLAKLPDAQSLSLIGSGWKDMTRVAAGDPSMWTAICEHNRTAILSELDRLVEEIQQLKSHLAADDLTGLQHWLDEAKRRKESTLV